tara:strand:+ start:1873 stop:2514 length:642 start_codon:yes stop_codon:yes gene_type:complete
MGIHELQYKRLLSELKFKNEELEIMDESMYDIHVEFELYYAEFLKENNLTKAELEKSKTEQFNKFQSDQETAKMAETDETGLIILDQMSDEDKEAKKVFAKLYKDIVKKCHPDRLSMDNMEHFNKMNTRFKAATWGYNNAKWSIVIKVAQELGIKPSNYKKMNGHLRREVKSVDKKINKHKSSFGWKLYEAEEKENKDNVIKDFIFSLFRRKL